jgi:hypothetical protein
VGTWEWVQAGRGGPGRTNTLVFKTEADKLVGTLKTPGFGPDATPTETKITDAKVTNDEIAFSITREGRDGTPSVTKYSGKLTADSIKGKTESTRGEREWEAKRVKDAAK